MFDKSMKTMKAKIILLNPFNKPKHVAIKIVSESMFHR